MSMNVRHFSKGFRALRGPRALDSTPSTDSAASDRSCLATDRLSGRSGSRPPVGYNTTREVGRRPRALCLHLRPAPLAQLNVAAGGLRHTYVRGLTRPRRCFKSVLACDIRRALVARPPCSWLTSRIVDSDIRVRMEDFGTRTPALLNQGRPPSPPPSRPARRVQPRS